MNRMEIMLIIYTDYYLLKNGKILIATQNIESKNIEIEISGWNCKFWIKDNKVIDMISLGQGKTELDVWNYEKEINDNFNYMMKIIMKNEIDRQRKTK